MAIIEPTTPADPPNGRFRGRLFYRAKGRTFSRQITIPVNPDTEKRGPAQGALAQASKKWLSVVDPTSKANWAANSKYQDRGQLEYVSIVSATNLAGLALPVTRTADPNPDPPTIVALGYNAALFFLSMQIASQAPPGQTQVNYSATPPTPRTSSPSIGDRRLIKSQTFTPNLVNLTADYLSTFGGVEPKGRPIMIAVEVIKAAIPADTKLTIASIIDLGAAGSAQGWTLGNPFPKNGSVPVSLTPLFGALPPAAPIDIVFTGPDMTTTMPASIPNVQATTGVITDTLGHRRDVDFQFLLSGSDGTTMSLPMGVTITI